MGDDVPLLAGVVLAPDCEAGVPAAGRAAPEVEELPPEDGWFAVVVPEPAPLAPVPALPDVVEPEDDCPDEVAGAAVAVPLWAAVDVGAVPLWAPVDVGAVLVPVAGVLAGAPASRRSPAPLAAGFVAPRLPVVAAPLLAASCRELPTLEVAFAEPDEPLPPESPEVAAPRLLAAPDPPLPLLGVAVAAPVVPVFPVVPEVAVLLPEVEDRAAPVSPPRAVDDAVELPVEPLVAVPLALELAEPELPPVAVPEALPVSPDRETADTPPEPPPLLVDSEEAGAEVPPLLL